MEHSLFNIVWFSPLEAIADLLKDKKLLDFTLPYHVLKNQLPERYVLIREIYIEGAAKVRVMPNESPITIGVEGSASRVLLSRVIVDHKSGSKLVLSEDTSPYQQVQLRGLLGLLGIIRVPFAHADKTYGGSIKGRSYLVSGKELKEDARMVTAVAK